MEARGGAARGSHLELLAQGIPLELALRRIVIESQLVQRARLAVSRLSLSHDRRAAHPDDHLARQLYLALGAAPAPLPASQL